MSLSLSLFTSVAWVAAWEATAANWKATMTLLGFCGRGWSWLGDKKPCGWRRKCSGTWKTVLGRALRRLIAAESALHRAACGSYECSLQWSQKEFSCQSAW